MFDSKSPQHILCFPNIALQWLRLSHIFKLWKIRLLCSFIISFPIGRTCTHIRFCPRCRPCLNFLGAPQIKRPVLGTDLCPKVQKCKRGRQKGGKEDKNCPHAKSSLQQRLLVGWKWKHSQASKKVFIFCGTFTRGCLIEIDCWWHKTIDKSWVGRPTTYMQNFSQK